MSPLRSVRCRSVPAWGLGPGADRAGGAGQQPCRDDGDVGAGPARRVADLNAVTLASAPCALETPGGATGHLDQLTGGTPALPLQRPAGWAGRRCETRLKCRPLCLCERLDAALPPERRSDPTWRARD